MYKILVKCQANSDDMAAWSILDLTQSDITVWNLILLRLRFDIRHSNAKPTARLLCDIMRKINKVSVFNIIKLWIPSPLHTQPPTLSCTGAFESTQTILSFAKTDGNHFPHRLRSSRDACRPNMFIKSNSRRQFDQSDVVVFLAALILRMWCDGGDINNLCTRPVSMNINDSQLDNDGRSRLTIVLAMRRFGESKNRSEIRTFKVDDNGFLLRTCQYKLGTDYRPSAFKRIRCVELIRAITDGRLEWNRMLSYVS